MSISSFANSLNQADRPDPAPSGSKQTNDADSAGDSSVHFRRLSTLSVHAGEAHQKMGHSITDPIVMASTFTFADTQAVIDFIEQQQDRGEYGRYGVPGEKVVEQKLAALEGAASAVLFSSGMAALVGLLNALLRSGDEIIFTDECYHRSRQYCHEYLSRFGVITHVVKTGDYQAIEAAISPKTKLLISESPTNPHLSVLDMERFAGIGQKHGIVTMVDATLATPFNCRPLKFGIDFVLHSATKYLGGHNDLLAGVILGSEAKTKPIRDLRGIMGSVNSPHNCYLLERGLKTFDLRMARHNQNGMAVARFLESHPRISRVLYPGLNSHPYHDLAKQTMRGFGGLITFEVAGADWRTTADVIDRIQMARIAPSLGGVETLIEQPLVMSYWSYTPEQRAQFGITDNMIRLACGIEDAEDIILDLAQALGS